MSSTSRLVAPAFNKILSFRRLSSSSSSSPLDHSAPSAIALLSSLLLQERTPSAALSLIREQPSLAGELYALIAVSGKSDAPLTPGSLAILHSLAACHRIPPSSASLLSQLLARFSSPADAASFLRDSLAAGAPAPDVFAFNSLLTALGRDGDLRGMTKDGSGSGLEQISAGFGFAGFGFGSQFSPVDFRVWVPEIFRVWGGS